jgi:hypothetical protein
VDFGDSEVVLKFVDTVNLAEGTDRRSPKVFSGAAERSDWIYEAKQLFLRLPAEREIAAASREKLRGEFRWLAAFGNSFDDRRREES